MLLTSRICIMTVFFFNDTATTEIYTLSLHDALPILKRSSRNAELDSRKVRQGGDRRDRRPHRGGFHPFRHDLQSTRRRRSEEHTSELQSRQYLVCRLLLEKKKKYYIIPQFYMMC